MKEQKLSAETANHTRSIIRDEYDAVRQCLREADGVTKLFRKTE